jgi:hypothetical protein
LQTAVKFRRRKTRALLILRSRRSGNVRMRRGLILKSERR